MKQGTALIAKTTFGFKNQGKGRVIVFKEGQKFWVTTTELFFKKHGCLKIDRWGKGSISHGYAFDMETINNYFDVE